MIVVRVELHSAVTRQVTEIGRMTIANVGGTQQLGDYEGRIMRKPDFSAITRTGQLRGHRRLSLTIWHLVARMLKNMGYSA